jgi:PAS domain-containing protein
MPLQRYLDMIPEEFKGLVGNTSNLYKEKDVRSKIISETATTYRFSQDIVGAKRDGSSIYTTVYMMRFMIICKKRIPHHLVEDRTALKTSQRKGSFFNNLEIMLIHTLGGRIKQANRSWEDILGGLRMN